MITRRTRLLAGGLLGLAAAAAAFLASVDDGRARPAALAAPTLAAADQPVVSAAYDSEVPADWTITDGAEVAVHAEPTAASEVTHIFPGGTSELSSTGRLARDGATTWRELKIPGATTGWVEAARLVPMAPPKEPAYECRALDGAAFCDTVGESDEGPGTE